MFSSNERISARQLQALLVLYLFGTAVIYLPGIAVSYSRQDGWVSVGIASIFAIICVYLITTVAVLFRGKSFHDYVCLLLSRPIGKLICLIISARVLFGLALQLRIFGEIVRSILLPHTPFWLIAVVMLALGGLAAHQGYETRGRVAEILVFIVFIPLVLLMVLSANGADFSNLMPTFLSPSETLLRGGFESGFAFSGIELLLVAVPFVGGSGVKTRKRVIIAIIFIGLLMTAATALAIARFKPNGVLDLNWPLLNLFFALEIPGAFMERQNAMVMAVWILTVFAASGAGLFFGAHLLRDAIGKGQRSSYLLPIILVLIVLAYIPSNAITALNWSRVLYRYTVPALALFLPFLLLVLARIRRIGE